MLRLCVLTLALLPGIAFAVGDEDDEIPTTTETTTDCGDGQIWDEKTKGCVSPQESHLDDETLFRAAREFAYAERYGDAIAALNAMADPMDDRALAVLGFAYRGMGDVDRSFATYDMALQRNPDNLLARSYLGQAYVAQGKLDLARAQLTEIRRRGGRQTWAEIALRQAIETGRGFSY